MAQAGVSISKWILTLGCVSILASCSTPDKKTDTPPELPVVKNVVQVPDFNADSTYSFIKTQVDFGPRVPSTKAHEKCAEWYINKLKSYGLAVHVQEGTVTDYENRSMKIKNIMGSFNPGSKARIVLFSHWDSRRIADDDSVRKNEAIDGADDGASGCGVMLEVARQIAKVSPQIGVDVMFLDAEDTGEPHSLAMAKHTEDAWCLGTQYWTKNLPPDYHPRFGILLDMVGAKNATFPMEANSMAFASDYVKKIWQEAADIGFSNFFLYTEDGQITDDHFYINRDAKIPTVDIINYNSVTGGFGSYHHTHADNMSIIDRNTLKGVGQTLLQVIYSEKP